jgi:hypothetical protein
MIELLRADYPTWRLEAHLEEIRQNVSLVTQCPHLATTCEIIELRTMDQHLSDGHCTSVTSYRNATGLGHCWDERQGQVETRQT